MVSFTRGESQTINKGQNKKQVTGNTEIDPSQMGRGPRDGGRGEEAEGKTQERRCGRYLCQLRTGTPAPRAVNVC